MRVRVSLIILPILCVYYNRTIKLILVMVMAINLYFTPDITDIMLTVTP